MKFRTTINIESPDFKINHLSKIVCLGSCFADNIGNKLSNSKLDILCNPTGITYNPLSLADSILNAINNRPIDGNDLFCQEDRWVHYDYHSQMSHPDKQETIKLINKQSSLLHDYLVNSDILILSFGTAFVFKLLDNHQLINNCHKMPNSKFERQLCTVNEIILKLKTIFLKLWEINPKLNIITAISPIRHKRDGMVQNQRSKSTLHLAIQALNDIYNQLYYFPSYEIMLDDLRDYRYYEIDMVHPSVMAINYIWELFSEQFFTTETNLLNKQIYAISNAYKHRPFNPSSDSHIAFKKDQVKKINDLLKQHPNLDFNKELAFFQNK